MNKRAMGEAARLWMRQPLSSSEDQKNQMVRIFLEEVLTLPAITVSEFEEGYKEAVDSAANAIYHLAVDEKKRERFWRRIAEVFPDDYSPNLVEELTTWDLCGWEIVHFVLSFAEVQTFIALRQAIMFGESESPYFRHNFSASMERLGELIGFYMYN